MDHIVFDLEVEKVPEEKGITWDDTHILGTACLCLYSEQENRLRIYGGTPEEIKAAQHRILQADRITSFNGLLFDYPVLWAFPRQQWTTDMAGAYSKFTSYAQHPLEITTKPFATASSAQLCQYLYPRSNDILQKIWRAAGLDPFTFTDTHKGWGLDAVCSATIGSQKIGYGGDAPKWHQAGEWYRVANYCADDVMLTYDLSKFIDRYGYIISPKDRAKLYLK